jgi:N-methylhydantoinase A
VRCELGTDLSGATALTAAPPDERETREVFFTSTGFVEAEIRSLAAITPGEVVAGPAIIEGPATTVVIEPQAAARRLPSGSLVINPEGNR